MACQVAVFASCILVSQALLLPGRDRLRMEWLPSTTSIASVHLLVGMDGVLRIKGKTNTKAADEALHAAGIIPTDIPADDAALAPMQDLQAACIPKGDHDTIKCTGSQREPHGALGSGCSTKQEQATASSFHKVLLAARIRSQEWTLIMEDDVVPVSENWSEHFRNAWNSLPEDSLPQMIRLGWCVSQDSVENVDYNGTYQVLGAGFDNDKAYLAGGCSTAFLLQKQAVRFMLNLFPLCGPLDSCITNELLFWPPYCQFRNISSAECWKTDSLKHMDFAGSYAKTKSWYQQPQRGILVHDQRHQQ